MYVSNFEVKTSEEYPLTELKLGEFGIISSHKLLSDHPDIGSVVTRVRGEHAPTEIVSLHPKIVIWGENTSNYRYKPLGDVEITIKAEEK